MPDTIHPEIATAFEGFLQKSRYKALFGGRGSAKSHFFAQSGVANAVSSRRFRMVCIREVQKSLKESAKRLIEDKIEVLGVGSQFDIKHDEIRTANGGLIMFQGMQDHTSESIKSLEGFNVAWIEEAHTLSERSLELLRPTIRAPGSEIWASWNPRSSSDPIDAFFRGEHPPDNSIIQRVSFLDNPWFPDELEEERHHDEKFAPERYGHIWLGDYEPMAVGAIWDRLVIHNSRLAASTVPAMDKIVIGNDPAMSSDANSSDEYGVVVCGRSGSKGYVLEDISKVYTPHQWAVQAIAAYDHWDADAIIIEDNQGGEHVENTIKTVRPDARVIRVHVSRRKPDRAKPISAMYYQGHMAHAGTFAKLEDQMCLMTSIDYDGTGSPDRLDAMVLAMTHLFPQVIRKKTKKKDKREPLGSGAWMS